MAGDACATCGIPMQERSPNSPAVRYCQDDWYDHQYGLPPEQRSSVFKDIKGTEAWKRNSKSEK